MWKYETIIFLSAFIVLRIINHRPNNLWTKLPVHDVDGNICEGEDDSGDPVDFWNRVERLLRCAHCSGYTPEKYNWFLIHPLKYWYLFGKRVLFSLHNFAQ